MNDLCICVLKCNNCGKDVEIHHRSRLNHNHIFCNHKCEAEYRKNHQILNAICPICGKKFHIKPSHISDKMGNCCSIQCSKELRKIKMTGEGNHQFGLRGNKNASWKSDFHVTNYGYLEKRTLDHPFKNCDGFVKYHRLVAEKYLLTNENSIEIDGKRYLHPDYVVHHKDENKNNNSIENLEIMTHSDHIKLHSKLRAERRNNPSIQKHNNGICPIFITPPIDK